MVRWVGKGAAAENCCVRAAECQASVSCFSIFVRPHRKKLDGNEEGS